MRTLTFSREQGMDPQFYSGGLPERYDSCERLFFNWHFLPHLNNPPSSILLHAFGRDTTSRPPSHVRWIDAEPLQKGVSLCDWGVAHHEQTGGGGITLAR